jgi:hypothetical protein
MTETTDLDSSWKLATGDSERIEVDGEKYTIEDLKYAIKTGDFILSEENAITETLPVEALHYILKTQRRVIENGRKLTIKVNSSDQVGILRTEKRLAARLAASFGIKRSAWEAQAERVFGYLKEKGITEIAIIHKDFRDYGKTAEELTRDETCELKERLFQHLNLTMTVRDWLDNLVTEDDPLYETTITRTTDLEETRERLQRTFTMGERSKLWDKDIQIPMHGRRSTILEYVEDHIMNSMERTTEEIEVADLIDATVGIDVDWLRERTIWHIDERAIKQQRIDVPGLRTEAEGQALQLGVEILRKYEDELFTKGDYPIVGLGLLVAEGRRLGLQDMIEQILGAGPIEISHGGTRYKLGGQDVMTLMMGTGGNLPELTVRGRGTTRAERTNIHEAETELATQITDALREYAQDDGRGAKIMDLLQYEVNPETLTKRWNELNTRKYTDLNDILKRTLGETVITPPERMTATKGCTEEKAIDERYEAEWSKFMDEEVTTTVGTLLETRQIVDRIAGGRPLLCLTEEEIGQISGNAIVARRRELHESCLRVVDQYRDDLHRDRMQMTVGDLYRTLYQGSEWGGVEDMSQWLNGESQISVTKRLTTEAFLAGKPESILINITDPKQEAPALEQLLRRTIREEIKKDKVRSDSALGQRLDDMVKTQRIIRRLLDGSDQTNILAVIRNEADIEGNEHEPVFRRLDDTEGALKAMMAMVDKSELIRIVGQFIENVYGESWTDIMAETREEEVPKEKEEQIRLEEAKLKTVTKKFGKTEVTMPLFDITTPEALNELLQTRPEVDRQFMTAPFFDVGTVISYADGSSLTLEHPISRWQLLMSAVEEQHGWYTTRSLMSPQQRTTQARVSWPRALRGVKEITSALTYEGPVADPSTHADFVYAMAKGVWSFDSTQGKPYIPEYFDWTPQQTVEAKSREGSDRPDSELSVNATIVSKWDDIKRSNRKAIDGTQSVREYLDTITMTALADNGTSMPLTTEQKVIVIDLLISKDRLDTIADPGNDTDSIFTYTSDVGEAIGWSDATAGIRTVIMTGTTRDTRGSSDTAMSDLRDLLIHIGLLSRGE